MNLFDMGLGNRRQYVATLLGLNPHSPETWPMERIDAMIKAAERCAVDKLSWDAMRLVGK